MYNTEKKMGENLGEKKLMHNVHNHIPEITVQVTLVSRLDFIKDK